MKKCLCIFLLIFSTLALASAKQPGILPPAFNGWEIGRQSVKQGTDPAAANAADAAVLKEYGLHDFEIATYTRNGRSMQVKAARFETLSGAFGAFTFYRQPQMPAEDIGDRGASNNARILFYRGNILVDASLDRVTAMSAADLRALADALPQPQGKESVVPPPTPKDLPKQSVLAGTDRYVVGPVALERLGIPLPADLVDFNKGAEVAFARYRSSAGEANLTLVEYPTPQIAAERLRVWQAAGIAGGPFYFRRRGPLLAAVNGDIPEGEAQSLLAAVNYDAEVTMIQSTRQDTPQDRGAFLFTLALLVIIFLGVALVLGLAFGGFRIVARKIFPNRGFDRPEEVEIISLNLRGPR